MPALFSYIIPFDTGAAPNPFWGVCTLVICKPKIRRSAEVGDWVIATGSKNSPNGDIRGKLIYAMKVTEKLTMQEYDSYTKEILQKKITVWKNIDPRFRVGDSVYDFSFDPPRIRRGVHDEKNRVSDLSGKFALLSEHFYYFGDNPIDIPIHLESIVCKSRGHRSKSNEKYLNLFLEWLNGLGLKLNTLYGKPSGKLFQNLAINDLKNGVYSICGENNI